MRFCNATLRCWHFPTYKYVQTKPKHWAHMITMAMGALATEKLQLQKLLPPLSIISQQVEKENGQLREGSLASGMPP